MLALLLCVVAWANEVPLPTVDALVALPSTADRVAALTAVLQSGTTEGETLSKAATAIEVLKKLDAAGRTDPAVVSGFLEAALSNEAERREDAIEVAAYGLPPGPRPPAPAVMSGVVVGSAPEIDYDDLRAYKAGHLYKGNKQVVSAYMSGSYATVSSVQNWTVFQNSRALGSREFASEVADEAKLAHFRRRDHATAAWSIGLGVVGVAALAAGISLADEDNQIGSSIALITSGSASIGLSVYLPVVVWTRRQWVANTYEPEEAQAQIDRYNDALRDELELTVEDVRDIDFGP